LPYFFVGHLLQYELQLKQSKIKKIKIMKQLIVLSILFAGEVHAMARSSLKTYRERRGLKKSSVYEPYGRIKKGKSALFVIQKHDASHLHYDFRLEIDGVLKSWAVPKGLPEKVGVKRLAVPTDDHPYEYARFEGIIPQGHYGGGTVMVWDIGTYQNIKTKDNELVPMSECYDEGRIEIIINGKKIQGLFAVVRTKSLAAKDAWLVIKMKAIPGIKPKAPKKKVRKDVSALTGRTMSQITHDHDAEWD
jgi:bifunctional non-homologous end joining protein LigD